MRGGWSIVLLLTCFAARAGAQDVAAPPADAPEDDDAMARTHFEAGRQHYDRGRYDLALGEFEVAYEMSEQPKLLFNLYLATERLGRLQESADYLERYLPHAEEDRPVLEERLANLRQRIADAAAAERGAVAPPPPSTRASSGPSAAAIVSFSAGGAGLVTFALFALLSSGEDADLASTCGRDAGRRCSTDDTATLSTYNTIADLGLGVTLIGAGLGVAFMLLDGDDTPASGDVAFTPIVTPSALGASVTGAM